MSGKRIILALVFTVLSLAAQAQDGQKNELGLLLGASVTPSLDITSGSNIEFGDALTFQATYARRLAKIAPAAIYFEVPFLAVPQAGINSLNGAVPANYAALFITPGVRLKLIPDSTFSPWVSVGGGYARFDESSERVDGSPNTAPIGTNRAAVQFGGGVDIRTPFRIVFPVSLRAEVRDLYSGKANYNAFTGSGFQHNVVFSGGFVVHF